MKPFSAFVRKEFHHIFRDTTSMAIMLLLPIIMLILFGFAMTTEVKHTKVAIVDASNDPLTQRIIERIQTSAYFEVTEVLHHPGDLERHMRKGDVQLIVSFSESFQERFNHSGNAQVALIADGTDPNSAKTRVAYATSIIRACQLEFAGTTGLLPGIQPTVRLLYNPQMKGAYNFVPGVMGMILMLICAMMTSISIAREKEFGTMEILLVSPMKPLHMILAKTIPYLVISLVNLISCLLLSVFLLGVPIAGNLLLLVGFSLIYIFVNLALGLLISSLVKTQLVALLVSGMVLMIPVIFLSGMLFTIDNMPFFFQWASHLLPAKWYIIGVKNIMIKGLGIADILPELSILVGMAVVFITASLKSFKYRLS